MLRGARHLKRRTNTIPVKTAASIAFALQWGRALSHAEIQKSSPSRVRSSCFNGAAHFRTRKFPATNAVQRTVSKLQWGRALSHAEINRMLKSFLPPAQLQWGRALSHAEMCAGGVTDRALQRFNGAAHFRTRKSRRSLSLSAECACFNGAAHFRTRKLTIRAVSATIKLASMGPRTFARGNEWRDSSSLRPGASFNGAAHFRTRKFQPPLQSVAPYVLQWGRALSHAEILCWRCDQGRTTKLQWGRALSHAEMAPNVTDTMSVTTLQWGRALSHAEIYTIGGTPVTYDVASMGPRTFARGNLSLATNAEMVEALQWGRALSHAEISLRTPPSSGDYIGFNGAAHFRTRKSATRLATPCATLCFNGAAHFRTRKSSA